MTAPDLKTRQEAIERALTEAQAKPDRDRRPLLWQNKRQMFDMVRLPLDMVVLNPNSHRIRSQLESLPIERQKQVPNDPWSDEAQHIITEIIESTSGFEDVLAEMREIGQEDPGVVMRSGVLINANTRVVALRKLNPHGHVDLLVLPPTPDPKDVARLELDLQEKRDVKQPYTFTNSLLFLEELKNIFGYSDEDAARALRINKDPKKAVEDVRQRTRVLALIREIQKRSGGIIPLTFFDTVSVALEELDRAYESRRKPDPKGAEKIKETRILGILTNVEYRKLRRFDSPERIENHVVMALGDSEIVEGPVGDAINAALSQADGEGEELPGLADLGDDEQGDDPSLGALVDLVATSYGKDEVSLPTENGEVQTSWDELKRTVAEALDYAAEDVKSQDNVQKSLHGPAQQLREARTRVDRALIAYRKVAKDPKFVAGKFEYELKRLGHAMEAVRAELQKNNGKR